MPHFIQSIITVKASKKLIKIEQILHFVNKIFMLKLLAKNFICTKKNLIMVMKIVALMCGDAGFWSSIPGEFLKNSMDNLSLYHYSSKNSSFFEKIYEA